MTIVRLFNDGESECADCVWSEYDEERGFKERASRYPLAALEIVEKSC